MKTEINYKSNLNLIKLGGLSLREQASWAKMMSLRGKLTAPACHPTKFVNKSE
jgi:hypothetical protein